MNIWIVIQQVGEYDEKQDFPMKAFDTESAANTTCAIWQKEQDDIRAKAQAEWKEKYGNQKPFDHPPFPYMNELPRYSVSGPVELEVSNVN